MTDELKVGDRTTTAVGRDVIVLALDGDHAWIKAVDNGDHWTYRIASLTRIEPAVPQLLFRVGQGVRQRSTGEQGIVGEILHPISYKVKWPDGGENQYGEDDLEAVPEVCPTCGGKVGDAD